MRFSVVGLAALLAATVSASPELLLNRKNWAVTATGNSASAGLAIDYNSGTSWQNGYPQNGNEWFNVTFPNSLTFNQLVLSGNSGDYPRGLSVYIYPSASGNPKIITPTSSISGSIFTYDLQGTQQGVALCLHVGQTSGSAWWTITELNLYFSPPAGVVQLTAAPNFASSNANQQSLALDGNTGTVWQSGAAMAGTEIFQVDLGSNYVVSIVNLDYSGHFGDYARAWKIYLWTDGQTSANGQVVTMGAQSGTPAEVMAQAITFTATTARYVSFHQTGTSSGSWWSIAEFQVFGVSSSTTTTSPTTTSTTSSTSTMSTITSKPTTATSTKTTTVTSTKATSTTSTTTSKTFTSTTKTSTSTKPTTTSTKATSTSTKSTSIATSATSTPTGPVTLAYYGEWVSLGCYNDSVAARTLVTGMNVANNVTVESCCDACQAAGYQFAGLEYSTQCFCGQQFANNGGPISGSPDVSGCSMTCQGNSLEYCGGPNRLNVYNFTGTLSGNPSPTGGPTTQTTGLPAGWRYGGCYTDTTGARSLAQSAMTSSSLTVQSCIAFCSPQYSVAGMEYSSQCYCGNYIQNGASLIKNPGPGDCAMACSGNSSQVCGGPNRLTVYSTSTNITIIPPPSVKQTNLPGDWSYTKCYAEGPNFDSNAQHALPWQWLVPGNLTVEMCLNQCAEFGYPAAGVEYGDECYCGDPSDLVAVGATPAPETDCNMACAGGPAELCGGSARFNLYQWSGNLNNWATPSNPGYYQFLIGGPVVPLLTTVTITNKVVMLEKIASANLNSTHAYEFDYSLSDAGKAFREMHVSSDVFCSAGAILPDIAGRVINLGGWSLNALLGVRLYTPTGRPGVNGTTDWEENDSVLALQMPRWYPTALSLANGSIAVVGGEIGSNGPNQPNMEIIPTPPGGPVVNLSILLETDRNNLYPFMHILPSSKIFIMAFNEAQLLNPVTFQTVATLPTIPGTPGLPGGRTYPLEGSSAILPMYPPYTRAEILTCGGSVGAGQTALDNCVRIAPEDPNPTWLVERMPFKRVMPNLVVLPDGTYLIVNGCQFGAAGFALGEDPTLTALLYNPAAPVNSRFSILNTTIVARMYHSEAILLHDGRVLITGSDPLDTRFPEEYRIEVYIPPYLTTGLRQPTYTFTNNYTDWAYNDKVKITVNLYNGNTQTMQVNLLTSGVSTHSNQMNNRFLSLAFTCSSNVCTLTAPPNANVCPPGWYFVFILDGPTPSHGQWVRVGGDPANLGAWPDLPGFTPPGL